MGGRRSKHQAPNGEEQQEVWINGPWKAENWL